MTEKVSQIEISNYDLRGSETVDNVASITFEDPDNTEGSYCVGFKFKGGDLKNSNNWEYNHANYWTPEIFEDDSLTENPVTNERVSEVLERCGLSINILLENYCILLNSGK